MEQPNVRSGSFLLPCDYTTAAVRQSGDTHDLTSPPDADGRHALQIDCATVHVVCVPSFAFARQSSVIKMPFSQNASTLSQ